MTIRVLLVDDDHLMRAGLRMILETAGGVEVVGEASDGEAAVEAAARCCPDVVLMDIRMPGMDGLEATRRIARLGEDSPRVLVLTTFELDEYVFEALRAGASGFLLKRTPPETLIEGIRLVASGEALLAPSVTRRLIDEFARRPATNRADPGVLDALTEREREVLQLVARGLSNSELAERLYVSGATVKTHVKRILMKLGVHGRVQAVVWPTNSASSSLAPTRRQTAATPEDLLPLGDTSPDLTTRVPKRRHSYRFCTRVPGAVGAPDLRLTRRLT